MAPRKLIIAMLILLGFSTGLAVFTPDPPRPERQVIEAEPEPETPGATGTAGERDKGVKPDTSRSAAGSGTRRIEAVAGRQAQDLTATARERLVLTVRSDRTAVIEVDGLGLTAVATRYAPATFDLLLPDRAGSYTVREQRGGRILDISVREQG